MCFIFLLCMLMTSANTSLKKKNFPLGWKCYKTIGSYISCVFIEIWSTWEVWRVLKKLELLLAMPRATLMLLSCSPNFLHASYLDEHTLMYEPIVNSNMSSVNSSIWKWMKLTAQMISFISQWILSFLLFMWILWNESGGKCFHSYITYWLTRTWLIPFHEDMVK